MAAPERWSASARLCSFSNPHLISCSEESVESIRYPPSRPGLLIRFLVNDARFRCSITFLHSASDVSSDMTICPEQLNKHASGWAPACFACAPSAYSRAHMRRANHEKQKRAFSPREETGCRFAEGRTWIRTRDARESVGLTSLLHGRLPVLSLTACEPDPRPRATRRGGHSQLGTTTGLESDACSAPHTARPWRSHYGEAKIVTMPARDEPRLPEVSLRGAGDEHRFAQAAGEFASRPTGDCSSRRSFPARFTCCAFPLGIATPEQNRKICERSEGSAVRLAFPPGPNLMVLFRQQRLTAWSVFSLTSNADRSGPGHPSRVIEGIPETQSYAATKSSSACMVSRLVPVGRLGSNSRWTCSPRPALYHDFPRARNV